MKPKLNSSEKTSPGTKEVAQKKAGHLTSQSQDFPGWYQDVVAKAELAENGPVRGTMVIRPYGYSIWERMQAEVDMRIKETGTPNAYFPLFIPDEYIRKESTHLEGFSPELAVVTHGGGKELAEPVVVRPTSETIINSLFSKWINSYRDLPYKVNQWANVVRWEMRPRVFLRTTEFLWQEGHTAHATKDEAWNFAVGVLNNVYKDFMEKILLMPVFVGLKTSAEQFPGATHSLSCEGIMKDGKALQMGTSHALGQSFSKMFNIKFLDKDGEHFVWQTSWGVSTRMMGGLIMSHGDDRGLYVPPKLAPIQVMIMVIKPSEDDGSQESIDTAVKAITQELKAEGIRVQVDDLEGSFGRRSVDWELKGIPLRIEIGPRDLKEDKAVLVRRDLAGSDSADAPISAKTPVPLKAIAETIKQELQLAEQRQWQKALDNRQQNTIEVDNLNDALEAVKQSFAVISWDTLGESGEAVLLESGASVRCLVAEDGSLPKSTQDPNLKAILARAY